MELPASFFSLKLISRYDGQCTIAHHQMVFLLWEAVLCIVMCLTL